MTIIHVALDIPIDRLFDYFAPDANTTDIGRRVTVPFGKRQIIGIILSLSEESSVPDEKLKQTRQIDRDIPPLSPALLELFAFCNRYYHYPIGQIVMGCLPALLRKPKPISTRQQHELHDWILTDLGKTITLSALPKRAHAKRTLLTRLQENKRISAETYHGLTPHSRKLLREFTEQGWTIQAPATKEHQPHITPPVLPAPTEEQAHAITRILSGIGKYTPVLLHGITGSGKTEIYLRITAELLKQQRQILILVPEINLTPQLEAIFHQRFFDVPLTSLHSRLNDRERLHNWLQAQRGEARIILGTRLAIFTPLPALGLIIVDEEQDHSFKQQEGLRYSARDLAIYRAKQKNIPIILGSATPALESYYHAINGRYQLLQLRSRAISTAKLPEISCIDLRTHRTQEGLAEPLLHALKQTLQQKQQSLVFINRRGYAPVLLCKSCRWIAACKRCSSRLVVHLRDRSLRCHYCGHQQSILPACPQCGDPDILPFGHGTQRIENALNTLFPQARILRIDRDSISRKHAWQNILDAVHRGEADILVGTQLLAKGHDFPNLALVCVLNADASLYSTDFRAEELLFAQLMQVAGRAGRANVPGRVLIQTELPQHPLYQALLRQNYDAYAKILLQERKASDFPPYIHLAVLQADAPAVADALEFLERAAKTAVASAHLTHIRLFDPVPAQMTRLKGRERAQLLIQARSRKRLQAFLSDWYQAITKLPIGSKIRWHLDVDPLMV